VKGEPGLLLNPVVAMGNGYVMGGSQAAEEVATNMGLHLKKYACMHIETKTVTYGLIYVRSLAVLFELLCTWNRMGENWKYWEVE
jgi:hypothetical protein